MFSVNTLTLSVADLQNGSARLALSGATVGRRVDFYYAPWGATPGPQSWTLATTVTISTNPTLITFTPSSGLGYYNWIAIQYDSTNTFGEDTSPVVYRNLTDPTVVSTWEQCCDALVTGIQSLTLSGLANSKIQKFWFPDTNKNIQPVPPCVQIFPTSKEQYKNQLTGLDDVGYAVAVLFIDVANRGSQQNMTRDLLWRSITASAFRFQALTQVSNCYNCNIDPGIVVDPVGWQKNNYIYSSLVFVFICRERRGTPP
jgi:hypothetical protein